MKYAVITARHSVSGVPLAQIRLADAFRRRGADVDLIFGWLGAGSIQGIASSNVIDLGVARAIFMLPKLVRYFRHARPAVVFTAEDHLNAIVLFAAVLSGSAARICCSSRVTPFDTYGSGAALKRIAFKAIMRSLMWRATLLTCVSRDMVAQYQQVFGVTRHQCVYNIVDRRISDDLMREPVEHEWLNDPAIKIVIAAGSLEPWKGFRDVVRAMTRVQESARLLILGEGSQRNELEAMVAELGLSRRVHLMGQVQNPLAYFSKSDVFALSSRVEGMPNVLVEAMMCGCTPVAMDCPTGPSELLRAGVHGHLVAVGDWETMGNAINESLDRPAPREWLDHLVAPFSEAAVMGRYTQLLKLEHLQLHEADGTSQSDVGDVLR